MLYILIRVIISIVILLVGIKLYKRVSCKKNKSLLVVILTLIVILINLIEIEKPFVTFSSPETAYKYSELSSANPEFVVDGQSSFFVVAYNKTKGYYNYAIVPKKGNRWLIKENAKSTNSTIKDRTIINVYRYKNTDDYYLSISDMDFKECVITDNCNSKFMRSDSLCNNEFSYYAYIKNLNEQYRITVNGETIVIET